jgi:ribulose kinase
VIFSHARGADLRAEAKRRGITVYELLNEELERQAEHAPFPAAPTDEIHVLPYFHGNRSPRADPSLRGVVSGLKLSDSVESLALLYLATMQAIAYGTRHIIEAMNASGYRIDTLIVTGGGAKNPVLMREHADATGCRLLLPREREAVLLGSAVLGAVAAGEYPSVLEAMSAMSATDRVVGAAGGEVGAYHERKYRVFRRMYDDQLAYRSLMAP